MEWTGRIRGPKVFSHLSRWLATGETDLMCRVSGAKCVYLSDELIVGQIPAFARMQILCPAE